MAAFSVKTFVRRFLGDEEGATAIEYGLIVALMTIVVVTGIVALGGSNDGMWGRVSTQIGNVLK